MRTRRSWRNQDRLWRYLAPPKPPAAAPVTEESTAARLLASPATSPRLRRWARRVADKAAARERIAALIQREIDHG